MAGIQEYAIECAILKVLGSETLDFAVDEGVQIHGGYGFLQDYPIERAYRDSRINRLFEGTNEINRLLIPDQLMRRALKGVLPVIPAALKLRDELMEPSFDEPQGEWGREDLAIANLKKLVLALAGLAMQRFGEGLKEEQEIVAGLADIIIETYAAESGVLRAQQTGDATQADLARLYLDDALDNAHSRAVKLLPRMADGDELRVMLSFARRLTKREPVDTIAMQRRVAARVLEVEGYPAVA
jgi:alkylation response protein AidB-like acyl-CoA dehydrogenase